MNWTKFRQSILNKENLEAGFNLIKFGAVVYCVSEYLLEVTVCVGPSMLPTLSKWGDVVIQEKLTPRFGRLKIGDVVILNSPTNPNKTVCKRITGLEGDTMVVWSQRRFMEQKTVKVPTGHVWVEGDNPRNSTDSRSYGPVPSGLVMGRVMLKIWPIWDMQWIKSELPTYEAQNYRHHQQQPWR
mmetsp:Transcript_21129/g.27733  ORF Transcript_21129/g.27733 Transcript_21129/m.27733 type:complete len:184 (+) Transcript_21129:190-741(+)